jgi:hypothetical protein
MICQFSALYIFFSLLSSLRYSSATNQEGLDFLAKNKDAPGVVTLPSGLQYKVLKKGDGKYHPAVGTPCSCHYSGQLIDGTVFDSSYDRGEPTTFAPNQVIKGKYTYVARGYCVDLKVVFCGFLQSISFIFHSRMDGSHAAHGRRRQVGNVYSQ